MVSVTQMRNFWRSSEERHMTNRLERGLRIVLMLQSGKSYGAIHLANEFSVSRRTIFRDIAILRELGLPIEFDPQDTSYHLSPANVAGQWSHPGDQSTGPLDSNQLLEVLRQAVKSEDQIAADGSDANQTTLIAAESPSQYTSSGSSLDRDQRVDSSHPAPSGNHSKFSVIEFERTLDLVQFLSAAISNAATLEIDQGVMGDASTSRLAIIPTELRFTASTWKLLASTLAGKSIELELGSFSVSYPSTENAKRSNESSASE